jgi:hypothetical protein
MDRPTTSVSCAASAVPSVSALMVPTNRLTPRLRDRGLDEKIVVISLFPILLESMDANT